MADLYKVVVYAPTAHADLIREVIGKAGGGQLGKYTFCSFSSKGIGRFKPEDGAKPHIGKVGNLEAVEEERIEVTCTASVVDQVIQVIKKSHPYEEVALDVYPLEIR